MISTQPPPHERQLLQLLHRGRSHLRHRLSQASEARVDVRNRDGVLQLSSALSECAALAPMATKQQEKWHLTAQAPGCSRVLLTEAAVADVLE